MEPYNDTIFGRFGGKTCELTNTGFIFYLNFITVCKQHKFNYFITRLYLRPSGSKAAAPSLKMMMN